MMLNTHQTPAPVGEPLRFAVAAAHAVPLLSESLADPWPLQEGEEIVTAPAGDLPKKAKELLGRSDLQRLGENLFKKLCIDTDFKRCVLDAVERTLKP